MSEAQKPHVADTETPDNASDIASTTSDQRSLASPTLTPTEEKVLSQSADFYTSYEKSNSKLHSENKLKKNKVIDCPMPELLRRAKPLGPVKYAKHGKYAKNAREAKYAGSPLPTEANKVIDAIQNAEAVEAAEAVRAARAARAAEHAELAE